VSEANARRRAADGEASLAPYLPAGKDFNLTRRVDFEETANLLDLDTTYLTPGQRYAVVGVW
jgi:hypothetical protein